MASSTNLCLTRIVHGAIRVILQRTSLHHINGDSSSSRLKSSASLAEHWRFFPSCMNSPSGRQTKDASETSSALLSRVSEIIRLVTVPRYDLKPKLMRVLVLILIGALRTTGFASAAPLSATKATTPAAAANLPSLSTSQQLVSEIAVKVAPLLAAGVRLRSVALGCQPPAGALLNQVAPGITRLNSRGFVVELRAGDRTLACSASLDAQRQILVAAHDIAQGQALSSADLELRWIDAFGGSMDALSALPAHGPFLAATAIRAGDPLLTIQLTRPLAIRPGDLVIVLVKNGPVTVRTQLEARSSAAVGDSVSVVNPDTGLPLTVTATGERTAELVMQ
jgi:flagella basal body P-ring formation protein FlgA